MGILCIFKNILRKEERREREFWKSGNLEVSGGIASFS